VAGRGERPVRTPTQATATGRTLTRAKSTALAHDLADYLDDDNHDRALTGRLTKGRVPADIVYGARKTSTVR
jgi:hypothetical protein